MYRRRYLLSKTWISRTDDGIIARFMGIHEGTEEVLVGADNIGDVAARCINCSNAGFGYRAIHIHTVLGKIRGRTFCRYDHHTIFWLGGSVAASTHLFRHSQTPL